MINMTNLSNVGDGGVYTSINDFIKWDQNFYKNHTGREFARIDRNNGEEFLSNFRARE